MKKKLVPFLVLGVIALAIIAAIFYFTNPTVSARSTLKNDWKINIPSSAKVVYSESEGKSTDKNSYYYYVFEATDGEAILNALTWQEGGNNTGRANFTSRVIDMMDIEPDMLPSYEGEYYVTAFTRLDDSEIYLLYNADKESLYVGVWKKRLTFEDK